MKKGKDFMAYILLEISCIDSFQLRSSIERRFIRNLASNQNSKSLEWQRFIFLTRALSSRVFDDVYNCKVYKPSGFNSSSTV